MNDQQKLVGIDDMTAYFPQTYLAVSELAAARDLEYAKLNKGLGLTAMAIPDAREDAATMAANAVLELLERNQLDPRSIGRIYLGTESALDGAKPTATYVLDMLQSYFAEPYGADCFLNCDVVDLTFACIGAVDALQNTLEWVRAGQERVGIVVAADNARYELGSGGEYTQGAGAIAMLIKTSPRLMAIQPAFGVATRPVHDFFKPQIKVSKRKLVEEVLALAGVEGINVDTILDRLSASIEVHGILDSNEESLVLHRDTPVFDGPFSNECYQDRIREALNDFQNEAGRHVGEPVTDNWRRLVFHLPYAYQARRMFAEVFMEEARLRGDWEVLAAELPLTEPEVEEYADAAAYDKAYRQFLRAITKTDRYRRFVAEKIEKGERASSLVGNMYAASIFLSLMSTLEADLTEGVELEGSTFGFFGYGSGSKSKVFEGSIQPGWQEVVGQFRLLNKLENRTPISYDTYEALHRGRLTVNVAPQPGVFYLKEVCAEKGVREGERAYTLQRAKEAPAHNPG